MKTKSSLRKQKETNNKSTFNSESVGSYEKHPFFIKKTVAAKALLTQVGLPKQLSSKKSSV